ncbi:hypothetical protein RhiirB3_395628 [Rhizophagus irregularis]|nr:hypothetical protein RhiirB3_395628 [Rhizophagus irregularis]
MGRFGSLDDWNVNHQGLAFPEGLPDATSEKEEIFKLFLDQEPIVKKDPKARKEPIKPTNVSPVTIPTVPQETISTISRRSSISSIESINLQDYPPLQERRERLIEKLHN